MKYYSRISIITSFLGLWIDSFFSNKIQLIIGFILIFSFGILHGANDLLLIKKINNEKSNNSYLQIITYYCMIIATSIALFYFIPWFALLLFILFSAYHFGEQHWDFDNNLNHWFRRFFHFTYGIVLLFLLFTLKAEEVKNIIFSITNTQIPIIYFQKILYLFISFLGICFYLLFKKKIISLNKIIKEVFHLVVFAIIFKVSELIWGFALYFVFWHSIPSIVNQIIFIDGSLTINNCIKYIKSAFLYWIISLMGIFLFYYFLNETQIFSAVFFSFLAAITFPHVMVVFKMFDFKK
jgi:Brp/Blh family beta-carotene 15,15'-monooxygenase